MAKRKKGVSPVVSTILLVMIVVVLAIIILLWTGSYKREAIVKKIGNDIKSVEKLCTEITLTQEISEDGNSFGFINSGNVPIYEYDLKLTPTGSGKSKTIRVASADGGTVNPGYKSIIENQGNINDYERVRIIPILVGTSKDSLSKSMQYTCPDSAGINLK